MAENPRVNIACESGRGYLSLSGRADAAHDRAPVNKYRSEAVEA